MWVRYGVPVFVLGLVTPLGASTEAPVEDRLPTLHCLSIDDVQGSSTVECELVNDSIAEFLFDGNTESEPAYWIEHRRDGSWQGTNSERRTERPARQKLPAGVAISFSVPISDSTTPLRVRLNVYRGPDTPLIAVFSRAFRLPGQLEAAHDADVPLILCAALVPPKLIHRCGCRRADLHVVISRYLKNDRKNRREVVYIGARQHYAELDELMSRYNVCLCVIDALPDIHATREFAKRHLGSVYLNYFVESQRGSYNWNFQEHIVQENRTEALDASRQAIREGTVILPRGGPVIQEFAEHLAADVKQLVEDRDTGAKAFRYVRTGVDHFSLAFTYECIAATRYAPIDLQCTGWISPEGYEREDIMKVIF